MDSARQRLYRAEGVVIRRMDLGEADRIVTLFTLQQGKLRAVAKGVRRPESHLGGNLELFVRANVLLARGRNLDIITQAEMIDAYKGLREDLACIQGAFYLGELLDGLAAEGLANQPAYHLLLEALAALASGVSPEVVARYYEFRLLALMGYRLEVSRCVLCRRPLEPVDARLSLEGGGVVCGDCQATDPAALPLSLNALKILRLIEREPLATLTRYRLPASLRAELEALGHAAVRLRLEHEPRTWTFLAAEVRATRGP
jgi:DNA repair protein RecO (recombination protein O)